MKRFSVALFALFLSAAAWGQIEWKPLPKYKGFQMPMGFISHDDRGVVMVDIKVHLLGKPSEYRFHRVGWDGSVLETKVVPTTPPKSAKGKFYVGEPMVVDGRFWAYAMDVVQSGDNGIYVREVDLKNFSFKGDWKKIFDIPSFTRRDLRLPNRQLSSDSSQMLFFIDIKQPKKEDNEIGFWTFNGNFDKVWSSVITVDNSEKLSDLRDVVFIRDKEVVFCTREYHDKLRAEVKDKPNFHLEVTAVNGSGIVWTKSVGGNELFFFSEMLYHREEDNKVLLEGFYSKENAYSARGIYHYAFDLESGQQSEQRTGEFYDKLLDLDPERYEKMSARRAEKKKENDKEVYQMDLHEWVEVDNGDHCLIGEQKYFTTHQYSVMNSDGTVRWVTYTIAHTRLAYVSRLSAQGEIKWVRVIPKHQLMRSNMVSHGGQYPLSYLVARSAPLRLLFNDDIDNLDILEFGDDYEGFTPGEKESQMVVAAIDHDGTWAKDPLYQVESKRKLRITPMITGGYHVPEKGKVFVVGSGRKGFFVNAFDLP